MLDRSDIQKLIPHSGKMCLLDSVTHWDTTHISCTAISHRDPGNPLSQHGKLRALCGIEFAAQAMAIHGGLTGAVGQRPRAGLLVSVRDVESHVTHLSDYSAHLDIQAQQLMSAGNSVTYSFRIHAGSRELLNGRAMVLLDVGGDPT